MLVLNQILHPIIPSSIRERIIVDTIGLSRYAKQNRGYRYIFTFIDSLSNFAFCFPSFWRDAKSFLNSLKKLFQSEGPEKIFHSDNGGEFLGRIAVDFLESKGFTIVHGEPYRPEAQGQIERYNPTLKSKIRRYCEEGSYMYIDALDSIVYQYNCTVHRATNLPPFLVLKESTQRTQTGQIIIHYLNSAGKGSFFSIC